MLLSVSTLLGRVGHNFPLNNRLLTVGVNYISKSAIGIADDGLVTYILVTYSHTAPSTIIGKDNYKVELKIVFLVFISVSQ